MCSVLFVVLLSNLVPCGLCLDEVSVQSAAGKEAGPPKFLTQVASKIEISEGQSAHFEARLTPTEDPNMKVIF